MELTSQKGVGEVAKVTSSKFQLILECVWLYLVHQSWTLTHAYSGKQQGLMHPNQHRNPGYLARRNTSNHKGLDGSDTYTRWKIQGCNNNIEFKDIRHPKKRKALPQIETTSSCRADGDGSYWMESCSQGPCYLKACSWGSQGPLRTVAICH